MTNNKFRDRFKSLMDEYDPEHKNDYLLTIVTFDVNDIPDDIHILGMGCGGCIVEVLNEQVAGHFITHIDKKRKIH